MSVEDLIRFSISENKKEFNITTTKIESAEARQMAARATTQAHEVEVATKSLEERVQGSNSNKPAMKWVLPSLVSV